MQIAVEKIHVKEGRRGLDGVHVKELAESIQELGMLNPLTIDREYNLIAGLHRLEAVKQLGLKEVECTVSSLEGLQAELAEIDENIVRSGLSAIEYGEILLRRKEIYETLHPETKHGGDRRSEEIKRTKCPLDPVRSFVDDTAEKLKVDPRTVRRQIQTAKNLDPEAKEIIRSTDTQITKKGAMKLSRLEPGQQKEAAALLASKEINSIDEYTEMTEKKQDSAETSAELVKQEKRKEKEPKKIQKAASEPVQVSTEQKKTAQEQIQPKGPEVTSENYAPVLSVPDTRPGESRASLKEVVADLKDPDKDCSGTPDSFLAEYAAFVRKFHKEIAWYNDPYYDAVFPRMDGKQLAYLRKQTDSICAAAEDLFHKVERTVKK